MTPCGPHDPGASLPRIPGPAHVLSAPVIHIDGISKQHGRQILFIEASATINRGEKVGLVGPNGAGKTTIFRMIMQRGAARRAARSRVDRERHASATSARTSAR